METIIIDAWSIINNVRQWNNIKVESIDGNVELMVDLLQINGNNKANYVVVFDSIGLNKKEINVDVRFTSRFDNEKDNIFNDFRELLEIILDEFKSSRLIKIVSNKNDILQVANKYNLKVQQPESFWNELIEKRLHDIDLEAVSPKPTFIENIGIKTKDFFNAFSMGREEGLEDPKTGEKLPSALGGIGTSDPVFGKNIKLYSALVTLIIVLGFLLKKLFL